MPDFDATITSGVEARGYRRGPNATDGWDQYVIPVEDKIVTYRGLAASPLIPGRGAGRQNLMTVHNVSGSTILCSVRRIKVDVLQLSAALAVTVNPGIIRLTRFAGTPTGGSANTKGGEDTTMTTNSSIVVTADASADGTSSGTALTFTQGVHLNQTFAPRMVQTTGTAGNLPTYEPIDVAQFLFGEPDVEIAAGNGLGIQIDQMGTGANPTTNRYAVTLAWAEYTRP